MQAFLSCYKCKSRFRSSTYGVQVIRIEVVVLIHVAKKEPGQGGLATCIIFAVRHRPSGTVPAVFAARVSFLPSPNQVVCRRCRVPHISAWTAIYTRSLPPQYAHYISSNRSQRCQEAGTLHYSAVKVATKVCSHRRSVF